MTAGECLRGPAQLVLDPDRRSVTVRGIPLSLQRREFDLLSILLQERGRVVTFEEVARRSWGPHTDGDARFIYTAAWRLRRALEAAGVTGVIQSVRGVGYLVPDESGSDAGAADRPTGRVADPALVIFNPYVPERPIVMVNAAAATLSGYSAEVLTSDGFDTSRVWAPGERPYLDRAVEQAILEASAQSRGRQLRRSDGAIVTVTLTLSRLDSGIREPLMLLDVEPVVDVPETT